VGLIEDEFSKPLLSGITKGKRNKTRHIRIGIQRETAVRVSRGSPEVLVKISGFTKGGDHLKAHMTYISRNGKIDLEDENGVAYEGFDAVNSLWGEWDQTISDSGSLRANRRDAVKMVLSMPPGTDPKALKNAVRSFAQTEFENHEYVFAVHTDEAHPHVHLTVQMRGFNGERINPRKADLQRWREGFAHSLLNEGVDCVATPRTARNRSRGQSQARRHADERRKERGQGRWQGEFHPAKGFFVDRSKAEWDAIRERCRKIVQAAWLTAAMEFESGSDRFGQTRPNYKRYERNDEGRRNWRRDASLYQSSARDAGGTRETWPPNGLRNLSSGEVVRHRQPPEGLLQGVSRHRLGRSPEAHYDLRRERDLAGSDGAGDGGRMRVDATTVSLGKAAAPVVKRFAEKLADPSYKARREMER
jgi:hypothetical protein